MKRLALSLLLGNSLLASAAVSSEVHDLFDQAQAAVTAGQWDAAVALYEKAIVEHPEASLRWPEAQMDIAQALAKKGDFAAAAQAGHLALDAATNARAYDQAAVLEANILSAQDKGVDRANQFIAFLQGTGKTNPLDGVGYPTSPSRETAFAAMRQQAGDDASASRLRALTYLLSGKPKDALAQFADAFRRCDSMGDSQRAAADLATIGLRDVRGNRLSVTQDAQFIQYGPAGPDGKTGTADDLADPFAAYLPAAPAAGSGGLSGMSDADLATLRQVRDASQLYAGDPLFLPDFRHSAQLALVRSTSALDGWGAAGQKDWYLDRALGLAGIPASTGAARAFFLLGAELAARGRDLHFGGVQALWNEVDADMAAQHLASDPADNRIRMQYTTLGLALGKITNQNPPPTLKALTAPATF